MKRGLALLVAAGLAVFAVACGSGETSSVPDTCNV